MNDLASTSGMHTFPCAFNLAHGEDLLCRAFPICREPDLWLSATYYLCRVPDGKHTAKFSAHGKARNSGSV